MSDNNTYPFIPLGLDVVENKKMSATNFNEGVKIGSFYSGIISSLFNSGLAEESITEILIEYIRNENKRDE